MNLAQRAVRGRAWQARLPGMTQATPDTPLTLTMGALQQWHAALQRALANSDTPEALEYVAAAIGQLVQVESMMISLECQGRAPQLLYQQGIPELHRAAVLERYFSAGYLLDQIGRAHV